VDEPRHVASVVFIGNGLPAWESLGTLLTELLAGEESTGSRSMIKHVLGLCLLMLLKQNLLRMDLLVVTELLSTKRDWC